MRHMTSHFCRAALLAGLLLPGLLLPTWLWATPIFDPSTSTCTGINCSSVRVDGVVREAFGEVHPWVIELFANPGQCLRVAVTAEGADLEAVVIAPNGTVYRNDDGGVAACPLCPVVKVNPTPGPARGFYTVQIAHWLGNPVTANFTLLYGLYNAGNPNCAPATPPAVAEDDEDQTDMEKSESEGPKPPIPGGPAQ
jgi:hypothetical protein